MSTTAIRIPAEPIHDSIQITMSLLEARTLKQLFQYVGGDPNISPRRHFDSLNNALIMAGVNSAEHTFIGEPDIFYDDVERSTL